MVLADKQTFEGSERGSGSGGQRAFAFCASPAAASLFGAVRVPTNPPYANKPPSTPYFVREHATLFAVLERIIPGVM